MVKGPTHREASQPHHSNHLPLPQSVGLLGCRPGRVMSPAATKVCDAASRHGRRRRRSSGQRGIALVWRAAVQREAWGKYCDAFPTRLLGSAIVVSFKVLGKCKILENQEVVPLQTFFINTIPPFPRVTSEPPCFPCPLP